MEERRRYETTASLGIDAATEAIDELAAIKSRAREASVRAIRGMMRALRDGLRGSTLRGVPNLALSTTPYRAVRVRCKAIDVPLDCALGTGWGEKALCINLAGELVFARRNGRGDVQEWAVLDEELLAEDAEDVAEALVAMLKAHVATAERASEKFVDLQRLAERIVTALEEDEP